MATNSYFITMEGTEASGKTTQTNYIEKYLRDILGFRVVRTREPGGTEIAEAIRKILLYTIFEEKMSSMTEALLFAAARAQHIEGVIKPQLAIPHTIVLSDRYVDSSIVYQGYSRQLGLETVKAINEYAINGLYPDLTICLIIDHDEVLRRKYISKSELDRIELAGPDFHNKVYDGYKKLSEIFPERIRLMDATKSIDEVTQQIIAEIHAKLKIPLEPIDSYFAKLSDGSVHISKAIIDGALIHMLKSQNDIYKMALHEDFSGEISDEDRELFVKILNDNLPRGRNNLKLPVTVSDDISPTPNPISAEEMSAVVVANDYGTLSYYFSKIMRFYYDDYSEIDKEIDRCVYDFIKAKQNIDRSYQMAKPEEKKE